MRNYGKNSITVSGTVSGTWSLPLFNGYVRGCGPNLVFTSEYVGLELDMDDEYEVTVTVTCGADGFSWSQTVYAWLAGGDYNYTSELDMTPVVRSLPEDSESVLQLAVDGTTVAELAFYAVHGYMPQTDDLLPPAYLPYHDEHDVITFPIFAESYTVKDSAGNEWTASGSTYRYGVECEVAGGDSVWWTYGGRTHYAPAMMLPRVCETINIRWLGCNGMHKSWAFELLGEEYGFESTSEVMTGRGIGYLRTGRGTRTVTVRCSGASVELRRWLADIGSSRSIWWYERWTDTDGGDSYTLVPATCDGVEVDFTEPRADFEAEIKIMQER